MAHSQQHINHHKRKHKIILLKRKAPRTAEQKPLDAPITTTDHKTLDAPTHHTTHTDPKTAHTPTT